MGVGVLRGNGSVMVRQRHSPVKVSPVSLGEPFTDLKWPQDAARIARLGLPEFQTWIASIDPRELIFMAQNPKFERFLFWNYLVKVRAYRFLLKIKNMIRGFGYG